MTQDERDQITYQYRRLLKYEELERTANYIRKTLKEVEKSKDFNINWDSTVDHFSTESQITLNQVKDVFKTYVVKYTPQIKDLVVNNLKQELESIIQKMNEV